MVTVRCSRLEFVVARRIAQGETMTTVQDLHSYAARCDRLAQACYDAGVAETLRQLANDYRELANKRRAIFSPSENHEPINPGANDFQRPRKVNIIVAVARP